MPDVDEIPDEIEAVIQADLDLGELIDWMEDVDWSVVPTISTAEAAAWTERLIEAREATQDRYAELERADE